MLNGLVNQLVKSARSCGITLDELTHEVRKQFIVDALEHARGNQCKAAVDLKMHRNTLSRQVDELDINVHGIRSAMAVRKPVSSVSLPDYIEHITRKK